MNNVGTPRGLCADDLRALAAALDQITYRPPLEGGVQQYGALLEWSGEYDTSESFINASYDVDFGVWLVFVETSEVHPY